MNLCTNQGDPSATRLWRFARDDAAKQQSAPHKNIHRGAGSALFVYFKIYAALRKLVGCSTDSCPKNRSNPIIPACLWYNKIIGIREIFGSASRQDTRSRPGSRGPPMERKGVFMVARAGEWMMPLERCPALVLNADFRPLSYFPLSVWPWQEAVKAIFRESVTVISEYERTVRSPSWEMRLPSVLALKEYIPMARTPAFTRFNVFLRDRWQCQYCADYYKTPELTFDHVVPRSRGGRTTWDNIVTACQECNTRKGNKTPHEVHMHPITSPRQPSIYELQDHGRSFPPNFLHQSWNDFLYWDTELDA